MTPGDAYWVGVARPRKPAYLPRPFLTRFFLIYHCVYLLCLELGCLATTPDAVYLLVARATAAAFRARQIGSLCRTPLSDTKAA